ncbi:MAG: fibronectin type III domain-containing protein [Patescibacteria group bacterium]
MRKRELTIPTILGVLTIIGGLIGGVVLLNKPLRNLVGASPEETPKEVRITNVADTSFVVSWVTDKSTSGYVQYNGGLVVSDDRDQERGEIGNYFTHLVTIKALKSDTNYSFKIGSGKSLYDNLGKSYQITTASAVSQVPAADVAYGQVVTASGDPVEGAIVYLSLPGAVPQAALTKPSGSWVIPVASARSADLTGYAAYDREKEKTEITVQAGALGTSVINTTTGTTKPVANITLGENRSGETPAPTPVAGSKFSQGTLATDTGETLIILTPKSGEKVNSQKPEIMGRAPAGSKVIIKVESSQLFTETLTAGESGEWTYSVPEDLEPGVHTVTVTSIIDGITKTVKKNFVVEAAGVSNAPARVATPSATLKPTPKPTPTIAPRVAYPSTESGTPQSGNLTPTLILLILGGSLVITGFKISNLKF